MDNRPKLICSERVRDPQSPSCLSHFVPMCMPKEVSQMHRTHGITELVWPHVGFRPHMDVPLAADKVTTGMTQKLQKTTCGSLGMWISGYITIYSLYFFIYTAYVIYIYIYIYHTVIYTLLFC